MLDVCIVIACLALNAVFSAFEMAFVTISIEDVDENDTKMKLFKQNPERTLSVIQIGITLVGAIAAAVGGTGAVENLEPYLVGNFGISKSLAEAISVMIVIVPLTYFSVVFGELVPKTIALRYPDEVLKFGTHLIYLIEKFLSPIVTFLENSTSLILKVLGLNKVEEEDVPESVEIGDLPVYHRKFVHNLIALKKKRIKSVMIPWEKVSYFNFSDTDEDVKAKLKETHRSRFPVVDGDVLVGLFHVKEWNETINGKLVPWQSILGPSYSVTSEAMTLEVFLKMQESNHHLAVVREESGEFKGIVTIEDILEQIVGNIKDDLERNKISTRLLSHRSRISLKK